MTKTEAEFLMSKVIARAWRDPAFESELLRDPRSALAPMGLRVPDTAPTKLVFHKDTDDERHYVIPVAPKIHDLSEMDLEKIAAAQTQHVLPTILTK